METALIKVSLLLIVGHISETLSAELEMSLSTLILLRSR